MLRRIFITLFAAAAFAQAQEPDVEALPETLPTTGVPTAPAAPVDPSPASLPTPPVAQIPDDATRVAVLGYHELSEALPETAMRIRTSKFRQQMEAIRQLGISVISLEDFLAWRRGEKTLPKNCILLTLDDGWKSVYTDAFPILKEYRYPFTLYLYRDYVDLGGKSLTTPMIQEMLQSGASLGSHSSSHPFPATIKSHQKKGPADYSAFLQKEMGDSKTFLEKKFSRTVTTYAFPGGYHTEEMFNFGASLGYDTMFTVIPGKVRRSTPWMTVPRYMILGNYDRIFELATSFPEGGMIAGAGLGGVQTTPVPVTPEAGAVINTRLPLITVDLTSVTDLDPSTLTMKVVGFGEVPAVYDSVAKIYSWKINRKLRQPVCQVSVNWKNTAGKAPDVPLRWSFQLDREAAYFPAESEK